MLQSLIGYISVDDLTGFCQVSKAVWLHLSSVDTLNYLLKYYGIMSDKKDFRSVVFALKRKYSRSSLYRDEEEIDVLDVMMGGDPGDNPKLILLAIENIQYDELEIVSYYQGLPDAYNGMYPRFWMYAPSYGDVERNMSYIHHNPRDLLAGRIYRNDL